MVYIPWRPRNFVAEYAVEKCREYATDVQVKWQRDSQRSAERKLKRYTKLDISEQEIRLVIIQPGKLSDPIECTLQKYCLDSEGEECIPYEALSYTWGDPLCTKEIMLDGHSLYVRKNLCRALKQLRNLNEPRYMWIDALCINQLDNNERGEQVGIMRNIYQKASQVVLWLGEADRDSILAFKFLKLVDSQQKKQVFLRKSIGDDAYTNSWKSLRLLFNRPYWNRIWIIQEIAVAPSISVQCGPHSIEWSTLVLCDATWRRRRAAMTWKRSEWFEDVDKDKGAHRILGHMPGPFMLAETRRTFCGDLSEESEGSPEMELIEPTPSQNTILELIQTYWTSKATDPKDQIYALVGLASDCVNPDFTINYNSDIVEVHLDLLRHLKNSTKKLDMLGYSGIIESSSEDGYGITQDGSWLPTWTSENPSKLHLSKINSRDRYTAAGDSITTASFKRKSVTYWRNKLNISGCSVGTICQLGPALDYKDLSITKQDLRKVTQDIRRCFKFAKEALENIEATVSTQPATRQPSVNRLETNLDDFWKVLVCDRTIDGTKAPEEWKDQFNAIVKDDMPGASPQLRNVRPYQLAVLYCMNTRQLFVTTEGDFGVGPQNLNVPRWSESDDILVFFGCNVPMARGKGWNDPSPRDQGESKMPRPEPSKDHLKGWAYLQNYMSGEAIEDMELGYKQRQEFSLV